MCTSVCALPPVQVLRILHVEQHGRDELIHVLWLPDDGLQLVVDRLPDHALQPADPGNTDPGEKNVSAVKTVTFPQCRQFVLVSSGLNLCLQ